METNKQAEQLYNLADLSRILKVPSDRLRALILSGQMLGHDVFIPGGGHKGLRWSASRVCAIQRAWSTAAAA
jgi:hypothetical protein